MQHDKQLSDVLDWYFRINPRIRSQLTRDQYTFALRDFGEALRRFPIVADLTEEAIAELRRLLQSRGLAIRTINERVGRLISLWRFLAERGIVRNFPPRHRIPEPKRAPQAWTVGQMQQILAALSAAKGYVDGIPEGAWWRSLILAMWSSGERITALLSARWEFYDHETGYLLIPAEHRKGQYRDGVYRMDDPAKESIDAIHLPARVLIWPWPKDRSYLWIRYGSLLKRAGIASGRYSGFHKIRRSVASHYELAGGDASRLLGHSDRRITEKSYIDPRIARTPQAADRLPRIG